MPFTHWHAMCLHGMTLAGDVAVSAGGMSLSHGMAETLWMLRPVAVFRLRIYVRKLRLNMFLFKAFP